jgi:uncharacterized protein
MRALLLSLLLLATHVVAQNFPERSNTLVTDYANVLSPEQKQALESKLVAFNDSTSTQIAIVLMGSVGNYDIADYSVQLFNQWKIGQASKNNGVLILAAIEDRKVFITTGYGIEGVLPDALCKRVVNNDIVPNFKNKDYYTGLDAATNTIMSIVKGEFTADDYMKGGKAPGAMIWIVLVIIIIIIISKINGTRNYGRRNNIPFWTAWMLMNAASRRSGGSWGGFSGGGGFGGGGFGGFGGGGSGGGGAGGSW